MKDVIIPSLSKLKDWNILCWQWLNDYEKFCQDIDYEDAPHIYGEHGNTHLLSVAASKCSFSTMREVPIGRNKDGTTKDSNRFDLCIFHKTQSDFIEAKYLDTELNDDIWKKIDDRLKAAEQDANSIVNTYSLLSKNRQIRKIAVLFFTPKFQSNTTQTERKQGIDDLIHKVNRNINRVDIFAYCFFDKIANLQMQRDGNKFYPGVIMLVKCL